MATGANCTNGKTQPAHTKPLQILPCRFVEAYKHFCFHAAEATARLRLGRLDLAATHAIEATLFSFAADQALDQTTDLPQGDLVIENVNAKGKYLNVDGNQDCNGANVHLWDDPATTSTQWRICNVVGHRDEYTIENVNAVGKYLNVDGNQVTNGANVHLWDEPAFTSSQWRICAVVGKTNTYTFENVNAVGKYLNVDGNGTSNGANIHIWDDPTTVGSHWQIAQVGCDSSTRTNCGSGLSSSTRSILRTLPWLALVAAMHEETRTTYHSLRSNLMKSADLSSSLAQHLSNLIEYTAAHVGWMRLCSVPNGSRAWAYLVKVIWTAWCCYWQRPPWRGVNLGGWLLLEPGPSAKLWQRVKEFECSGRRFDDPVCEHSMCLLLDEIGRKEEVLEAHRRAWLADFSFDKIKELGLNAVRVPFGYWVVTGAYRDDLFLGPALEHLDHLIDLARRSDVQVVLDLHANPGGESGEAPAGRRNAEWKTSHWRFDDALEVLDILANRYAGYHCITGIQIANEPSQECKMGDLCDWYEKAINIIRHAGMHADEVAIVLPIYEYTRLEEFIALWGARGNFFRFENVVVDLHYYHVFWGPWECLSHEQHLAIVERHGQILQSLPCSMVGEWSICRPHQLKTDDIRNREFGDSQLRAYASASHGWFLWNYCDSQESWDLHTCIRKNWLPGNFWNASSLKSKPRTPPPGRFPQCYGSEERSILAEMLKASGRPDAAVHDLRNGSTRRSTIASTSPRQEQKRQRCNEGEPG